VADLFRRTIAICVRETAVGIREYCAPYRIGLILPLAPPFSKITDPRACLAKRNFSGRFGQSTMLSQTFPNGYLASDISSTSSDTHML
jgi:hypothetical protein